MAIPTVLSTFEGNLVAETRDGPVTMTSSGPVRYVPGAAAGSQAYVAEEATTNLVGNPWHAVDAAGWTGTTRDTSWAVQGPASGLITASGAGAEATIDVTASANTHTVQAIVRNNAASARTFQLRYNSTGAGDAVVVAAGAEQTITASVTGIGGSAALGVQVTDSEAAETYNVGYLGCEQKSYATSPCPAIAANGDIIAGYTWAGTAHASASTREAAYARATGVALPAARGSMIARYRRDINVAVGYAAMLGSTGTVGVDQLGIRISTAGKFTLGYRVNGGTFSTLETPAVVTAGVSHTHYIEWDGAYIGVAANDDPMTTGTRGIPSGNLDGRLWVGSANGVDVLNGAIDGVLIFDRPLTTAEREYLVNAPTWAWDTLIPRFGGIHVSVPVEPIAVAVSVPVDVTGG